MWCGTVRTSSGLTLMLEPPGEKTLASTSLDAYNKSTSGMLLHNTIVTVRSLITKPPSKSSCLETWQRQIRQNGRCQSVKKTGSALNIHTNETHQNHWLNSSKASRLQGYSPHSRGDSENSGKYLWFACSPGYPIMKMVHDLPQLHDCPLRHEIVSSRDL